MRCAGQGASTAPFRLGPLHWTAATMLLPHFVASTTPFAAARLAFSLPGSILGRPSRSHSLTPSGPAMPRHPLAGAVLSALLLLGGPEALTAQTLVPPSAGWRVHPPGRTLRPLPATAAPLHLALPADTAVHRHTVVGLLVGGVVGIAATAAFLTTFCSDPDTRCHADTAARAVFLISLPPAAVGGLIGWLIRTRD
jgi:hypothetical protein